MKDTLCIIMGGGCGQLQSAAGVLQALDQAGVTFTKYLGSSAGACIAGLHASSMPGAAISRLIKDTPVQKLYKFSMPGFLGQFIGCTDYVFTTDGIYDVLCQHMTQQAQKKARVAITQHSTYKPYMVAATPVTVLASAAIPQIFNKVKIGDKYYVDGGVKNMIPVPKITQLDRYQHIYIILCPQSQYSDPGTGLIKQAASAFLQTMDREITQIYEQGWAQLPNVTVIQPKADTVKLLGWSQGFQLNRLAYQYTKEYLKGK